MKKIIVILIILAILAGWLFAQVFIGQSGEDKSQEFLISPGESIVQITDNLKNQRLIGSEFLFKSYLKYAKLDGKIKTGNHELNGSWSIKQISNALALGSTLTDEITLQIKEGWTLRDIGSYLEGRGISSPDELYSYVGYPGVDYRIVSTFGTVNDLSGTYEILKDKPDFVSYEGYLFPDTYRFFKDATVEDIVDKLFSNFDIKFDENLRAEIKNQGKTIFEIVTMASVIQKESDKANMAKIAGVFYNRLNAPMRLQSDPTVNYITGKQTDRPTYDDIEVDSLYNTYRNDGLPLGPICNPGLDAIMAAIYPEKHDYYYFINTPDGDLIFAKTFEEHKQNRELYLK